MGLCEQSRGTAENPTCPLLYAQLDGVYQKMLV